MQVLVRESGAMLGDRITKAHTFVRRLLGLLGTMELPTGGGLHIRPCRSVHTYGMRYPIDVLHLDAASRVIGMEMELRPGRAGRRFKGTRSVIELPAGRLAQAELQVGDTILFAE